MLDLISLQNEQHTKKLAALRYEIWKLKDIEQDLRADDKHSLAAVARIMLGQHKKEYKELKANNNT